MPTELSPTTSLLAVATGVGLAAAVGLRIFVPLLLAGLAARLGHLPLAEGFGWLAGDPALLMFAVAAACEVAASFVPVLDHALDVIGGPVAVAAGVLLTASTLVEFAPWLRWAVALIVGGGTAAAVHGAGAGLRAGSTVTTAGLANPVLAGVELGGSAGLALLALALPLLALALLVAGAVWIGRRLGRLGRRGRRGAAAGLLLGLLLAGPDPAAADEAPDLVAFRLKDQFDVLHTVGSCRNAVVVVSVGDRKGHAFRSEWTPALRDSVADLAARHRVRFVPVAHLKGLPFFMKSTIKGKFSPERDEWVLMDYGGLFRRTYDLPADHCSLLVFGRDGRLLLHRDVTGFDPAVQAEIIAAVRGAAGG